MLDGTNVVLGVSGSIAAVRCVELIHEFRRQGADVRAVTSPAAESIINPWSLEFATGYPVVTELTGEIEHVELCGDDGWGDCFLLAPGTANSISKMASAIDDTPLTTCATTAIGANMPVVIAPAMHEPMWNHPGVLDAMDTLETWGVSVVEPRLEENKAKIASNESILTAVARQTTPQTLASTSVIVTSGATSEAIDPVRTITNRASGTMGREIARACHVRGASVSLVHHGPDVDYATVEHVERGSEMREAVLDQLPEADALISAAAISDFSVATADEKLDSGNTYELQLEPAPKLLDTVRANDADITIIGFKANHDAERDTLIAAAREQQERVGAAFVVANDAAVMGEQSTEAIIVDENATETVIGAKRHLAGIIADRVSQELS